MPVSRKNKSMKKSSKTHKRKNVMKGGEGEEYEMTNMTNMTSMSNTPYQVLTNQNMYKKRIFKKINKKNEENEKSLQKSSQKSMLNNSTMLNTMFNNNNNYMSSLSERVKISKKKNKGEYGENYLNKQNRINNQLENERLKMEEQKRLKMEEQKRLKMEEQKQMDNEKARIAEERRRIAEERRRIAQLRQLQNEQEQELMGKLSFKERIEYDRRKQEAYRVKMERTASSKSLIGSSTGKSKSSGLSHTERRSS